MNKNKLRNTIATLVVATVLIGMTFGAMADSGNVSNVPEPRPTISTADVSSTSVCGDRYYMTGQDLFGGRRLNRINPDMDVTHPERFERFSEYRDIRHDIPDWLIDSQMNRTMSRMSAPDWSAYDRLAGKNMAYQKVGDSDIPLVMLATTSSEYSFTYGITAGDLNGDGSDDVLVFSGMHNSTTDTYTFESVSAVNGDGAELWSQSIVYETSWMTKDPVYPAGDLNGDSKDDVIVESQSYDSTTDEYTCTVYAKRGYDGDEFWSQSITGDGWEYIWADSVDIWACPCGDLNGDSKDDVIVESQSYDSTTDEYTCTVYAKRGYDGDEFWSQSLICDSWGYMHFSYCDLNGDGKDDVAVGSWNYDSDTDKETVSVYAKRGYDGDEFWSQSITGEDAFMCPLACYDLNGDGKDDVIVESNSRSHDSAPNVYTMYAKRGYDGNLFWSQSSTGTGAYLRASLYCDLNGDDKDDVIVESRNYDSATNDYTIGVYARRGYDGNLFWSQDIVRESWWYDAYIWAYSYCDLNGDGKDDVAVGSSSRDSATGKYTKSVHTKRGYDGDEFWSQNITGEDVSLEVFSYCDLDGDNKDDVIVESESYDSTTDEYTCTVYVKRGYTGDEFWSQNITGEDVSLEVFSYCDLDGDNKDDVIVESESYDSTTDEYTCTVYVKRGYTGDEFWSQNITGEDAFMYPYSYCDLDGDNKDDVILESQSYDSVADEQTASVYAKRGYDGDQFWSQSVTGEDVWMEADYHNWWYHSNQDFDDDNLGDMLITTGISIDYTDVPTKVCAVKGNDGTSLWCKPSAPPVTGDLNGDGKLTPADAVIALNIVVSGDYNEYADVNDDGVVNSLDALMILQAAASSITI